MNRSALKLRHKYRRKYIIEAADFARNSFVLQPSLCCLDLNYCEYSKNKKPINTFAEYQKENELRGILGRWHLDVPSELEFNSSDIIVTQNWRPDPQFHLCFPLFHPGIFIIPVLLHYYKLDSLIVDFIKRSNNKLDTMKRFLSPIRVMKLYERSTWSLNLYDQFLPLLRKECSQNSSELVVDVMKTFGCPFLSWVLDTQKDDLEFFLYHAQKMKYDIWDVKSKAPLSFEYDPHFRPFYPVNVPFYPVNTCCVMETLHNVRTLFKYGFDFVCSELYMEEMKKSVFRYLTPGGEEYCLTEDFQKNLVIVTRNIEESGISMERSCHLFLAVELFLVKIHTVKTSDIPAIKEALGCIWSTTAEPYLCRSELKAIFRGTYTTRFPNAVMEFCRFYDNAICDGCFSDNYNPRTLSHLSRSKARKILGQNWQLPHGIDKLKIPPKIKLYLSLGL